MSYVFHGGENKRGRNRISIDIVVILIIVVFFCIRCIVVLNNYRERGAYAYVQLLNYCMPVVEELNYDASDYAENNLSIKKTSEDLCIHYRSVSYRLDKIVDITNINFHDSVEILAIKNGLIIYEMSKKLRN